MKLSKKLTIAIVLLIEILDKKITDKRIKSYNEYIERKRTQKPLRSSLSSAPSKYTRERYKPDTEYPRPVYANGGFKLTVNDNGIITSTTATSKYSPEELRAFYKINPYTNL